MSNIDASSQEEQITIADYRAAMDRAAKAERMADQASRVAAMAVAGIPTGTPPGKAFAEKYDGKLDDPDAIRTAALEWGLWKPEGASAPDPANPVTPADQAQVDADRAALQHSGVAPGLGDEPPSRHPGEEGLEAFYTSIGKGKNRETASSEVINRVTTAAIHGDERVLVHPWSKDELGYS